MEGQLELYNQTTNKVVKKMTKKPNLYSIGCAGYITAFSQTNDNRYEIILKGLCRFKLGTEQSITKGFRKAKSKLGPF